jgi:glycine cleavage system transcriptional repressor
MQLLVAGNWHAVARLESELSRLAEASGLSLHVRRTEARGLKEDHIPYSMDVIGPDHPGIVAGLAGFFTSRSVEIVEVASRSYAASQTGATMFAVQMMINVPVRLQIAQLREDFMEYCDSQNLDAMLEPVKN